MMRSQRLERAKGSRAPARSEERARATNHVRSEAERIKESRVRSHGSRKDWSGRRGRERPREAKRGARATNHARSEAERIKEIEGSIARIEERLERAKGIEPSCAAWEALSHPTHSAS